MTDTYVTTADRLLALERKVESLTSQLAATEKWNEELRDQIKLLFGTLRRMSRLEGFHDSLLLESVRQDIPPMPS